MRVLKVLHAWHPEGTGGTEVHARALAKDLAEAGHPVGVFARTCRPGQREYSLTVDWDGPVSILRVNNTFKQIPTFEWIYRNRGVHEGFLRSLDSFKPDLVHVHHLTGLSSTIVEEVKLRKLPLVMTLHDYWMVCPRGQRMTSDLELCEDVDREKCYRCLGSLWGHIFHDRGSERTVVDIRGRLSPAVLAEWDRHTAYILNLCDLLIAPSEFHRERMLDFPLDPERIIAVPHSLPWFSQETARPASRPPRRIGFLGSVSPVKGVHVLIEAFLKLDRSDLELHIHGAESPVHGDDSYKKRLRGLAGGDPRIHFRGPYGIEEVPGILADLDVLVAPSVWWESFCLTIREAMLAGVPVVASDHGAMREALDGEEDGLLFRPGDPEDLARVLTRLLGDEDLRARLGSRKSSVKSPRVHLREMVDLYERAGRISAARAPSLAVAPPVFPAPLEPAPLPPVPWKDVTFTLKQDGPAAVAVTASMPNPKQPVLGLKLRVLDRDREVSAVQLDVDLAALDPARRVSRTVAAQPAAAGDAGAATRGEEPEGGAARVSPPAGRRIVRERVAAAPATVTYRVAGPSGRVRRISVLRTPADAQP